MQYLIFITALLIVFGLIVASYYNRMVSKKNYMEEAWSGIDVFLKKRYDLVPSLVEVVKGYARHEQKLLEDLTALRANVRNATTSQERIDSENKLGNALFNVLAISENYPDLKANLNFSQLQQSLCDLEDDIESSRRYYNGTVRDNNLLVESFPCNIVAQLFGFSKGVFFKIDEVERNVPAIAF